MCFPNGESHEFEKGKPVVILGANGSGKTRLGVEIERLNDVGFGGSHGSNSLHVQRVSAQKSLSIAEETQILGYEASERSAFLGGNSEHANKLVYRYNNNPATHLLDDYNKVLSYFFSKHIRQMEKQRDRDLKAISEGKQRPEPTQTCVEQAQAVWNSLLPDRRLDLSGNEVHALGRTRYHGKEMSDGERVILYMILQAMVIKPNTVLIVDEPELHIHKAILNKLWDELERIRKDCVFIYITHDLDFAVSRNTDRIIWVKRFDGNASWEYEFISADDFSQLPEDLLYELIGTRKRVVFVEGTRDSLDYHLYQEIYKDKNIHVIPCGGCHEVINIVKAKNGYSKLSSIDAIGIVDRDYRTENEIQSLKLQGVYALGVAEVENLFVVPELLDIMSERMGCDDSTSEKAQNLLRSIYEGKRESQISEAFTREVTFQMSITHFETNMLNATEIKKKIDERFTLEYLTELSNAMQARFPNTQEVRDILRVFNFKDLSNKLGSLFACRNNEYPRRVIKLLRHNANGSRRKILDAVQPYLPTLPWQ